MISKPLLTTPDYKQCPKCLAEGKGPLPWHRFFTNRGRYDGLGGYCKTHALRYDNKYKVAHANKRAKLLEGVSIPNRVLDDLITSVGYCLACGTSDGLSIDHVIPIMRGGTHTVDNLQVLCTRCNSRKGARVIDYRAIWADEKVSNKGSGVGAGLV